MNKVITIGRQYGSGGREIGQKVAEYYGIPFYDNELITRAAKESGFAEENFAKAEDRATNSLLYSLAMGINVYGNQDFWIQWITLDDRIFLHNRMSFVKWQMRDRCVIGWQMCRLCSQRAGQYCQSVCESIHEISN